MIFAQRRTPIKTRDIPGSIGVSITIRAQKHSRLAAKSDAAAQVNFLKAGTGKQFSSVSIWQPTSHASAQIGIVISQK
jgi:hypothetical protein